MPPTMRQDSSGVVAVTNSFQDVNVNNDSQGQAATNEGAKAGKEKEKKSFFAKMFTPATHEELVERSDDLMFQRWGSSDSLTYQMVQRYWSAQRIEEHWRDLYKTKPRKFIKYLKKGYMEPIPQEQVNLFHNGVAYTDVPCRWIRTQTLAYPYPEGSPWENRAEKRLYYTLNAARLPDGSKPHHLSPLNVSRNPGAVIRRGNARNALQQPLPLDVIQLYGSPHDAFHEDTKIKSHEYSPQVQNTVYEARTAALHELADGIIHGRDHLETMILIDVSGSMTWDPHSGVYGPDGIRRFHDQPPNIVLVKNLVHRCLQHMIPRAQREHPSQRGIDLVTFSSVGRYHGEISASNFDREWDSKVRMGGGTQIMRGWQVVKNQFFEERHAENPGWGRWDEVFGWQTTAGMPKLSLLVFLDGEAMDMDEFELELLGETWAYVTIALVGMENCPHHHSHAIELERVAQFNPHVGFLDVHGRVLERYVVQDLLSSVYPVDPPGYEEITKPEFDLPGYEALPKDASQVTKKKSKN